MANPSFKPLLMFHDGIGSRINDLLRHVGAGDYVV
jgi:hypothetical protein